MGIAALLLAFCAIVAALEARPPIALAAAALALAASGASTAVSTAPPHLNLPGPEFLNEAPVEIVGHVTNNGSLLADGGMANATIIERLQ